MHHPKILVTGATGKTGAAVVAQLREKDWPVRAVVRQRDARSERLDRLGVETVVADLFDPEQMLAVMRGTARAYYCPPFHQYMIQSAAAFAVAATEAKLESVVGLTQWLAGAAHPSLSTRQHWLADRLFALLPGVASTAVAPGFFASMPHLELIGYAAQLGLYPMPVSGDSRNAPPSDEDIARVAVAALMDPARHDGRTYRPTGPTMLTVTEMVQILSRVLGRTVRHVKVPMWMLLKAARMDGIEGVLLAAMPYYFKDLASGAFAFGGPTDHVLEVTGRQPEDFETIARRYAALPKAHRSIGNGLGALARFMTVPFRPGMNPARFEREQGFPMPGNPRLAMDDAGWKADRTAVAASARVEPLRFAARA